MAFRTLAKFVSCSLLLVATHGYGQSEMTDAHKAWLMDEFAPKHQALIPKVAVADMFFGCNLERKVDPVPYQLGKIIEQMDKGLLAEKLSACLAGENAQSDAALNFGLVGCFHDQFSELSDADREKRMTLVTNAISRLSREQRQKSFTKCVTEQAIRYIK
ncbi:hypothetical protein DXX93_19150 [Thalassotalea euphylliae]|uniref:Uncharacterized protein n=1 Tax=Thalassotalea euphylliae TaxID=1655234 RepID=A0A3E0TUX5_9GAMM|nr:hypothetical protein [Thalassotalea euphylliae]REL28476.1 hypothetical protein DXX93_19150 [Thalassotalea euphylliae]